MVHFSIVIWVLLVVCDAYGDSSQSDGSSNTTLDIMVSNVKSAQSELDGVINSFIESATNLTSWINNTVQNELDQYDEKSANFSTNATSDTSSCTYLIGVNLKKSAGDLVSHLISCIEGIVTNAQSHYNGTSSSLQDIIETLTDMATVGIKKCASDVSGCVEKMLSTNFTDIPIDISSMVLHGGSLVGEFAVLQPSLIGCGAIAAVQSFAQKAEDAFAAMRECLDNSNSTSSS